MNGITINLRTGEAKARISDAVFEATRDVFELDIKARAKELSPVSDANPQIGDGKYRPTGLNRNSIDTEVTRDGEEVKAVLYTQSGYGGYLEVGTSKMEARPYMHPAAEEFIKTIPVRTKEKLSGR